MANIKRVEMQYFNGDEQIEITDYYREKKILQEQFTRQVASLLSDSINKVDKNKND